MTFNKLVAIGLSLLIFTSGFINKGTKIQENGTLAHQMKWEQKDSEWSFNGTIGDFIGNNLLDVNSISSSANMPFVILK